METNNVVQKFDPANSREKLTEFIDKHTPDFGLENLLPETVPQTNSDKAIITQARDLRRRAEKLLPQIDEDDAAEIKDLLETTKKALGVRDWQKLEQSCESLSDLLFYLED